jgi:DNA-binding IclR family transcriptional regulator
MPGNRYHLISVQRPGIQQDGYMHLPITSRVGPPARGPRAGLCLACQTAQVGSSSDVPALRRGLAILRLLASHAGPMTAAAVAGELGLPRSTAYHLLAELVGGGFVTHLPEDRRYGLGVAAFEVGSAYLRHDPLEALARPLLRSLVGRVGRTAHLGVLHGSETLYLVREQPERPPATPNVTITDVGVRLPAQLPASGRAMLGLLPAAQVRALFPSARSFLNRTGRGPTDLPGLRRLLASERRRGWR